MPGRDLPRTCSKTAPDGNGCVPDATGFDQKALTLDHSNALTAGDAAPSVFGVLHAHAPDAWTDRVIQYTVLLDNGTTQAAGSVGGLGPTDDVDVNYAVPLPPPGGTLKATLISCGDAYATACIGDSNQCDARTANGPPECKDCVGAPIRLSNGNMRIEQIDPLPSMSGVAMKRTYDSAGPSVTWFGVGWSSMFDRALYIYPPMIDGQYVMIWLDGTKRYIFRGVQGAFVQMWPLGAQRATLTVDGPTGAYTLREPARDIEVVMEPQTGLPVTYRSRSTGRALSISYNGTTPVHVSDSWGTFGWTIATSGHRIDSVAIDGTALTWQYVYTGGILTAVNGSGGATWRTYTYSGNYLTEARDAAGKLIESHTYDSFGRATSSLQSEGDIQSIDYIAPPSSFERIARVRSSSGAVTDYHIRYFGGRARTVQIDGNCASCGTNDAVFAYRPAGFTQPGGQLLRMQDGRGYVTVWTYDGSDRVTSVTKGYKPASCDPETDAARCRQTPEALRTLALSATSATETISYVYGDANWPDRPTAITRSSVANPGQTTTQTLTYDGATGTVLTDTTQGYVGTQLETHVATTVLCNGSEGASFAPGGPFAAAWLTLPQPAGLRKSVNGPRTDVADLTQWVYYPIDQAVPAFWRGHLAAVRDAAGNLTRFDSYDALGNPTRVVDPNGVATEYTYDGAGRVLTTTLKGVPGCDTALDPLCATDIVTSRTYQSTFGPLASETRANGGTTTYEYDDRGRLSAMIRAVSASLSERLEYSYDPLTGRKSAERYLSGQPGAWTLARSEAFRYDTFGRLIAVDHPDGKSVLYTYNAASNVATVQDENHTTPNTSYKYDPVNRLIRVTQTLSTAPGGTIATQYSYDLHGNLTSVIDPNGNNTTYAFDDFGRMKQQTSPVTGATTYGYGPTGNLTSTTDANGATAIRIYDALNRVTQAVSSKGGDVETVSWTYDDTTPGRFGRGRLATMSDPTGSTSYRYERRGLLRAELQTVQSTPYTTAFAYDADGNRSAITYPSARTVNYSYDFAGRPKTASSASTVYISSAAYLPFGPATQLVYGNGTTRTMRFDLRYQPLENKLAGPGGTIADYNYGKDAGGNIIGIFDAVDPTYNRGFAYDDLNRLTWANSASSLWGGVETYSYDAMGNMLNRRRTVGSWFDYGGRGDAGTGQRVQQTTFTYAGTTSKLASVDESGGSRSVQYDAAGNETLYLEGRTYSPRNLMTSMIVGDRDAGMIDYGYDGRGIRVWRTETGGTTHFHYSPELRLLSFGPLGTAASREIVWFGDGPVAQYDTANPLAVRYTLSDHLGTPFPQTDTSANVIWRAEYEPYGEIFQMRAGAATDQPLRFPGQEVATSTDRREERYNMFRWYRSSWGRMTQPDPVNQPRVVEGFNTVSRPFAQMDATSTYGYAVGNPVRYNDPLGLTPTPGVTPSAVAGCAFGVAKALQSAFPGTSDKYKHCMISGLMVTTCGPAFGATGSAIGASAFIGIAKEIKDLFGPGNAELADLVADYRGIKCGIKALGGSQTVDSCCKGCYP